MVEINFNKYMSLREATEGGDSKKKEGSASDGALGSKITLGDGNEYEPFTVSDDPKSEHYGKNKNLAPIVRAFKQGGNWGWSKDDKSGEDKPVKISGKKLYLAGGAVRDHLKGKKARNIELATNASPDEVYHVLRQNGFDFVGNEEQKPKAGKEPIFWIKKKSKSNRPFSFGVRVNEDEFDLDIFTKTPRGNVGKDLESGTHTDDAAGRDFTINGMYIALTNDNGPNKDLHDFYGGIHHLSSGKIQAIGDMSEKFKEDPSRMMRYARMLSTYGDPSKVSEEDKKCVGKSMCHLGKLAPDDIMGEFKKGMDKDDVDSRKYLTVFKDLGLLPAIFPGKEIDGEMPKELTELGDKHMPLAWMLRKNDPTSLEDSGLDSETVKKVAFLIKSLGLSEDIDPMGLDDLTNGYMNSGVSSRKLKDWATKLGGLDEGLLDAFLAHSRSPRVRVYVVGDDGTEKINDEFSDLLDPFTGQINKDGLNERKKHLEYGNFHKHLGFMHPTSTMKLETNKKMKLQ